MSGTSRAFSREGAVEVDAVAAALRPRFTVVTGEEVTVSRTWLDTFDWRLHSAGISLQHADGGPLIMQFPDGARLQAPLTGVKWPAQAHDLPTGPIRDALAPLIAPRALMPVVTVHSAAHEARVLDAEEKTVARLLTESVDDGTSQLRIQPLRGYDSDGDRIARLLSRIDGFRAVSTTPYDLALDPCRPQSHQWQRPGRAPSGNPRGRGHCGDADRICGGHRGERAGHDRVDRHRIPA